MLPRLIATDIDGTLLRGDGTVSRWTADVLANLPVPVVLVTARPIRWLARAYEQLGYAVPAVCCNGAVIHDPANGDEVEVPILADVVHEVCRRLRASDLDLRFAAEVDGGRTMLHEAGYPLRSDSGLDDVHQVAPTALTTRPVTKLLARTPPFSHDPDHLTIAVAAVTYGLVSVTHSSVSGLIEMCARGVTKASGLARYARSHNVAAAHVLAFGDMPNDLAMLTWAGCSVAVANAHPDVIAAATDVTWENDEDGVARHLVALFGTTVHCGQKPQDPPRPGSGPP